MFFFVYFYVRVCEVWLPKDYVFWLESLSTSSPLSHPHQCSTLPTPKTLSTLCTLSHPSNSNANGQCTQSSFHANIAAGKLVENKPSVKFQSRIMLHPPFAFSKILQYCTYYLQNQAKMKQQMERRG